MSDDKVSIVDRVKELSRRMAHRNRCGPISGECAFDVFEAIVGDEVARRHVEYWGGRPLSVQFSRSGFTPVWSVDQ